MFDERCIKRSQYSQCLKNTCSRHFRKRHNSHRKWVALLIVFQLLPHNNLLVFSIFAYGQLHFSIAYGQLHLIDTRKSVFYFLFKPIFLFSLVWDYFYSHYFYVSYERVLSFICFKLAVPSYFWESMSNFTALPDIVGVSFTCTWKCLTQLVMQGPSWLGFCILHKKSNQNSSTVFKKFDLDNDQHGDFCLCASSFSIKCKYSTLISGWHQPIKWCPQGAVQVAPSHTHVFESKGNQHMQCTMIYRCWEDSIYISVIFKWT